MHSIKKKNLAGEGSLGAQLRHCYSAHYGHGYYVTNIFQKAQKIHSRVIQSLLPVIIRFDTSRHSSLKTLRAHRNCRRPAAAGSGQAIFSSIFPNSQKISFEYVSVCFVIFCLSEASRFIDSHFVSPILRKE